APVAVAAPAPSAAPAAPATAAPAAQPAEAEAPAAVPPSDLPWIETARCTTCNECTQINAQLFAYNDNMQAYIANPDGGSFRQLVEAAEGCQVSIIHPGKPRNPDEPDLPALIERAKAFA
ncbi:MAG: ferredoxin, partial [Rhodobacteraceae bacterium]|nr:ferredoxin [Paracoccaceae bacterium]